jgi:hypothetical protein
MLLVATARSQAPSSCIKSTVDGVPRFVPVRPSIVTLLFQIGSAEDFLFAFVLVWLACTYWVSSHFILGLPSLGSSVAAFSARYVHCHYRAQHLLRYAIPTPKMSFPFVCTNHLITHRNPHRPPRHLRRSIYTTTVRPRQVLVPNRNRRRALDRLYIDCLLPPGTQPGQLTNVQLRARRSRERPYLRP